MTWPDPEHPGRRPGRRTEKSRWTSEVLTNRCDGSWRRKAPGVSGSDRWSAVPSPPGSGAPPGERRRPWRARVASVSASRAATTATAVPVAVGVASADVPATRRRTMAPASCASPAPAIVTARAARSAPTGFASVRPAGAIALVGASADRWTPIPTGAAPVIVVAPRAKAASGVGVSGDRTRAAPSYGRPRSGNGTFVTDL